MFCNVGVDSVCKDPEGELHMQAAAMYMQERIEALRRDIDKHGKVKAKKGQQAQPVAKVNPCSAFCVQILVVLFGSKHFPRRGYTHLPTEMPSVLSCYGPPNSVVM